MALSSNPFHDEATSYSETSSHTDLICEATLPESFPAGTPRFDIREIAIGPFLGKGAFCEVYQIKGFCQVLPVKSFPSCTHGLAECPDMYAVKIVRQDAKEKNEKTTQGTEDLFHEASILSQLEHPNIIRLYGVVPGGCSIVLECLVCTLQMKLELHWSVRMKQQMRLGYVMVPGARQRRSYFLKERLSHARDIASAMAYLHDKRIVHRDIKSSNIGFGRDGKVKIFDFGLSRKLHGGKEALLKSMNGSPRYMAPEVADFLPYTETCDVYSFTIVLWEMITCERAFALAGSTKSLLEWRVANKEERPPLEHPVWSNHQALSSLLQKGWQTEPSERPSMQYMYDNLQTSLSPILSSRRICDFLSVSF